MIVATDSIHGQILAVKQCGKETGGKLTGFLVGKLDRTDEFLLPTGAMKTRCVRRLEGDNA